jgi:hypothetical protein
MAHKILKQSRARARRHRRDDAAARGRQYSLFDAVPLAPQADAREFRRQAQLCERLISSLHQPELVAMLGQLHEEYEATATRIETTGSAATNRR